MNESNEKNESRKSLIKLISLVAILTTFFIMTTCCYQLRSTQVAIITTFEKPVKTETQAGLNFKFPWPIQKAYVFDLRTRLYQSPTVQYYIQGGFQIQASSFACWSIKDVDIYKNKIGISEIVGENQVSQLIFKNLKTVLSQHSFADLFGVSEEGKKSNFSLIENDVLERIQAEALRKYGIQISFFGFDRLSLPENVTEQVFERMKSERMKRVEKILSEAKVKAESIKKEADSEKNRIIIEAEAQANEIVGKADSEAFKYLDVYNKHPEFALFLKKLKALEDTVKSKTTILIDKSTPPFDMLSEQAHQLNQK